MNRRILMTVAAIALACATAHAQDKLSPEKFDRLDKLGYFTPSFKEAVHALVDTQHDLEDTLAEKVKLTKDLPNLQRDAAEAGAQTVALRQELAKYDHPEENDYEALVAKMNDAAAKVQDQIALAQAYVWTYPASPHQADAQRYLDQVTRKVSDQLKDEAATVAARNAAHALLVQRAQAKDLNLTEWRELLRGMSQAELVKLMGRPSSQQGEYWIYSGDWSTNASTHRRVGLQINFNGGRVLNVDEKPAGP